MKILIISGFLGAGKTTFIKELSQKTGRDFCIFENEYAQIDIDKALLSSDKNLNVWELTENCICCSGKQDFASSILTIANTIDPEFLIVEPTGVAKLSSIIENIKQIQYERISLLQPITIVDGNNIDFLKNKYADIFVDQILNAGQIIISKQENADSKTQQEIVNQLKNCGQSVGVGVVESGKNKKNNINIIATHYSKMENSWWQRLLETDLSGQIINIKNNSEADFENLSLTDVELASPVHLISFLEMLSFGVFGSIYRAKGFLPCGWQWLKFDLVDRIYQITGCEKQEEARAVFIGNKILRSDIRRLLSKQFNLNDIKKPVSSAQKINFGKN